MAERMQCAPLGFDEQVVRQLGQMVVLEVQDFQLRPLQPLSQLTNVIPARQQLPEAPAGEQPAAKNIKHKCSPSLAVNP